MVIIIEGLDGVGKTTLSKKIAQDYKFKYIKESYTEDSREKKARVARMMINQIDRKIYIYDRTTLIDDFVYGFLNKKQSPLLNYLKKIKQTLSESVIIHLQLDEQKRQKQFNQRGDNYITNDDVKKIDQNYKQFYLDLKNVNYINLTGNIEKDVEKIMEVVKNDKNITHCIK